MGIEDVIKAQTDALNKNTAQLGEVLAALQANTAILTTMNEGRAEALSALTAKDAEPAKPKPRTRKASEPEAEPAKTEEQTAEVAPAWSPDLSVEGLRAVLVPYVAGAGGDEAEKDRRIENIQAVLAELGFEAVNPTEGKKHIENDDDRRKAVFYVMRFNAGLPVDFKADYDFNSDPLTQALPDKSATDGLGI